MTELGSNVYSSLYWHLLLIDLPSLTYGTTIGFQYNSYATAIVRWHGLASVLALLLTVFSLARNVLESLPRQCRSLLPDKISTLHYCSALRLLASGLIHGIIHALLTHPLTNTSSKSEMKQNNGTRNVSLTAMVSFFVNNREMTEFPTPTYHAITAYDFFNDVETWTGYLLFALVALILFNGFFLRKLLANHWTRLQIHRTIYHGILLVLVIHQSHWWWSFIVLSTTIFDWFVGYFFLTCKLTIIDVKRIAAEEHENDYCNNDVIELTLNPHDSETRAVTSTKSTTTGSNFPPGSYGRFNYTKSNRFEWHDFTIMLRDQRLHPYRKITVRSVGRWTRSVYRQANVGDTILMKGPYRTISVEKISTLLDNDTIFMIATGTNVTHFCNILDYTLPFYDETIDVTLPSRWILVWIVKSRFDVNYALCSIERYANRPIVYHELCISRNESSDVELRAMNAQQSLIGSSAAEDFTERPNVNVSQGQRPNLNGIVNRYYNASEKNAMLVCTNVNNVTRKAGEVAKQNKMKFYNESLY